MSLATWSWIFLVLYIGLMLAFGLIGQRRVKGSDDFATARSSYGPLFLAFAFAATTASGSTFLGFPAIAYKAGMSAVWATFLYPMGVYLGVWICIRVIDRVGARFGNRSIPEYLGERYRSELMRILVAVFSLLLFFYLAAQLISGLVMFEIMLGLSPPAALLITAGVLLIYIVLGGAHADILTDGVQGALMVAFAAMILLLFVTGAGLDGGLSGVVSALREQDENLVALTNPTQPLFNSWWAIGAFFFYCLPTGLLPHIGNKIWALDSKASKARFVRIAFTFGLLLGMLGLGGILARAVLGDSLLADGDSANAALPLLFIELFPSWLAALLGMGILSAIMSTADGLVISSAQVLANDIYRLSFVPRRRAHVAPETIDRRVLAISRFATVGVMLASTALAWVLRERNITLVVGMGSGGMMAAFAGPLLLGAVWRGVTAPGAIAGLVSGMLVFVVTHMGLLDATWFDGTPLLDAALWIEAQAPNPFSCAVLGEIASVAATWIVSKLTQPLPERHLADVFG